MQEKRKPRMKEILLAYKKQKKMAPYKYIHLQFAQADTQTNN
jgi:hypothetical protein